jgi:hypothetical protein
MDELFGNLIYLLPIALIIVRIISAAGNSKKKKPPSGPARPDETVRSAEAPRRVPREGMDPVMREFLERFGVKPPPAAPKSAPVRKRTVKEKSALQKKEPVKIQPLFIDTDASKQAEQAEDLGKAATEQRGVPKLPVGLSPLQQGFLWAEILGPAKAMQD